MLQDGLSVKIETSESTDESEAASGADLEFDPEDAIHQAVLAEKEKRKPKLIQARRTVERTPSPPAPVSSASPTQDSRDIRTVPAQQKLTHTMILLWAEMHFERTGQWPQRNSGAIVDCPGEWWNIVDSLLSKGGRGLPGGTSLAELISESRTVLHRTTVTDLTEEQILSWADEWCSRTGAWPDKRSSEFAADNTNITWSMIHAALLYGTHGLPGGASLRKLLQEQRAMGHPVT